MYSVRSDKLLTHAEAAVILQPLMRKKDAGAWLLSDRRSAPAIPFQVHGAEVHYLISDLRRFISALLGSALELRRIPADIGLERRQMEERIGHRERRLRPPILLGRGIDRRIWPQGERRAAVEARRPS